MKTRSTKSQRGFTLIELLVAMAITTVIITILVSVTSMALDTWNRSRSEIRASRQGKAMIDTMAYDFESFVIRKGNTFEWLYAKSNPSTQGPNGSTSPNAIDLIFFTAATDRYDGKIGTADDMGGDVSTVGYRLAYKDPIASANNDDYKTFVVYRKIVNPDETFNSLLGNADIKTAFDAVATNGTAIDAEENFICENVYQFTITFHVDVTKTESGDTTVTSVSVPIGQGTGGTMSDEFKMTGGGVQTTFVPASFTNDQLKSGRLTSIEISMSVITDFGLKQMRNRTFANATAKAEFIAENTYQYSKLVRVPGS
jgi:prepilin-type N-terminal cleavage/methylation domain-containing protein